MKSFNIFKCLEKDDKEVIHSQFLKFLILYYPQQFFNDFLGIEFQIGEPKTEVSFNKYGLKGRFDLIVIENNKINLLIENKFKAFPTEFQLNKYDSFLKQDDQNPKCILITFSNKLCCNNYLFRNNWIIKDYIELLDFCHTLPVESTPKGIFIQHYIEFLGEYIEKFLQLNSLNGLSLISKESNFWKKLVFTGIATLLSDELNAQGCYAICFEGRQFEPGINIFKKNASDYENRFKFKIYTCWFEYQKGKFRLKMGQDSLKQHREASILQNIPEGYRTIKKPGNDAKSFTLIEKPIEIYDFNSLKNDIIQEFNYLRTQLPIK